MAKLCTRTAQGRRGLQRPSKAIGIHILNPKSIQIDKYHHSSFITEKEAEFCTSKIWNCIP